MKHDTAVQATAIQELWPQIGEWLTARDRPKHVLLGGRVGIPVDGEKLRALAGDRYLTPDMLARRVGYSKDMIIKVMNGLREPSAALTRDLCIALECQVTELLPGPPGRPVIRDLRTTA